MTLCEFTSRQKLENAAKVLTWNVMYFSDCLASLESVKMHLLEQQMT